MKKQLAQKNFVCIGCNEKRYAFDFVSLYCMDFHEFLCKFCWSLQIYRSKSTNSLTCSVNPHQEIGLMGVIIEKILSIDCMMCKNNKIRYFSEKVCQRGDVVCFECQNSWSSKLKMNPTCGFCEKPLKIREESWSW